jgi:hypothetical protein
MSAYIVSTEVMNTVVNAIMAEFHKPHRYRREFAGVDLSLPDAEQQLAARLYAMNQAAVIARYPDTHAEGGYSEIPEYRFRMQVVRALHAHKAISCLLYQCTEGTVPASPLYRELEEFKQQLAERIVTSLPEWEKAPWG